MGMDRLADQVEKERRDVMILATVMEQEPIDVVDIARRTDIPEHKVRQSVRMLENDGLVEPTPDGAVPAEDAADIVASIDDGVDALVERVAELKSIIPDDVDR